MDLTQEEIDRAMVQNAEAVEREVLREKPAKPSPKGGRPKGGRRAAARSLGVDEATIRDAEEHVSDLDAYPFMQEKGWKRSQAAEIRDALDDLPVRERPKVIALLDQASVVGDRHGRLGGS